MNLTKFSVKCVHHSALGVRRPLKSLVIGPSFLVCYLEIEFLKKIWIDAPSLKYSNGTVAISNILKPVKPQNYCVLHYDAMKN